MIVSPQHYPVESPSFEWAVKLRQPVSIVVIAACAALLATTPLSWQGASLIGLALDSLGFVLVVVAAFGRIWSSLYISGYKEDRVVTEGPYAIVRNPLYVFSFLGALGLGLATRHVAVLAVVAAAFILYYPLVVLTEERNLQGKFGQVYGDYASRTPRFFPHRFQLVEPDVYPVRPRHARRSLQQIILFFWAYLILHLAAVFQQGGGSAHLPIF
ncbi:isoprenylcysteine carboxylmethyltransferase family protein [Desulfobulbus sp.]|jgi:protein-S-isoprenylcysteine O-methyltransferase Ste14|uniref:methyltransferase family protein n=1 Tax=Desulfobulbus sp. TaxID=895 RepID=UPI0027BA71CC|nr:isoprenylcysteine carboxylmethyltransferase family protein [Desulfobulbus sp.]